MGSGVHHAPALELHQVILDSSPIQSYQRIPTILTVSCGTIRHQAHGIGQAAAMALIQSSRSAAPKTLPTKELQNAVDDFRRILTDDQRAELRELRAVPDADAVLVLTAQLDMSSARSRGPSIASRLHPVLQFVRESSAIIDTFVPSHPEIAALVWGSVKLTMQVRRRNPPPFLGDELSNCIQVVLNFTSYYERISDLFMQFGRDCPRFADYQALFPDSLELQRAVRDFNASIISCCKHLVEALQQPWQTQLRSAFLQSFQQEFDPDLEKIRRCGLEVKQEIKLAKVMLRPAMQG
ncbi:hypothetical protein CSOJ01_08047 [Colletotrichum sojae]|uniref:Uncharacterized protein n=1 Tax=Colletotrichum sojae TaxID=2175907 RepID=A0A8H6J7U2_9PEZI|nr:hypothetical protein CSOJ01_08047 [Colletotrichum sojae]